MDIRFVIITLLMLAFRFAAMVAAVLVGLALWERWFKRRPLA